MKYILLIFVIIWSVNVNGQGETRKVLFLGNSYTYENNLPDLVSQLALSSNDILIYDSNLIGGYTLQEHFESSVSLNKVLSDEWDYIVLQEQSQLPSFISPIAFMDGFSSLKNYIKQNKPCTQITSFMTWGYQNGDTQNCPINPGVCTYDGMQNLLSDRYMSMSDLYESEVTPVGIVWRYIKENHPSINLYQTDGSHPSVAGSYIAACCFYTSLFRKDPTLITYDYVLDATTASTIRNAVKSLVYDQMLNWYIGRYVPNSDFNYTIGDGFNEVVMNGNTMLYKDSFEWDFGDGTTSTELNPIHSYVANGSYTIQLKSYKCFLGQNIESTFEKTVNFCAHTNTVFPSLMLCPNETGTLWTQKADSYQWYDFQGNPIEEATNQWLEVSEYGYYSVQTTIDGCTERSQQTLVDVWLDNPDCNLGVVDIENTLEIIISPNPVQDLLYIKSSKGLSEVLVFDFLTRKSILQSDSNNSVDVSNLVQGIYILKVVTEDNEKKFLKFVKY